jgi:hypothetical protein
VANALKNSKGVGKMFAGCGSRLGAWAFATLRVSDTSAEKSDEKALQRCAQLFRLELRKPSAIEISVKGCRNSK